MMRRARIALLAAAMSLSAAVMAQQAAAPAQSASRVSAPAFSKPVVLRGTLGDEQIQVHLRSKADVEEGYEGDYFIFGHSQKILLAGDLDGEEAAFEESENGTDISGQWEGKLNGETISGEWQSADGSVKKPFTIKLMRTDDKAKAARSAR